MRAACWDALCAHFQVHGLDAETWKKVDVVYIDIADRSQVDSKVKKLNSNDQHWDI